VNRSQITGRHILVLRFCDLRSAVTPPDAVLLRVQRLPTPYLHVDGGPKNARSNYDFRQTCRPTMPPRQP
jgi:hypothetical protein